MCPRFRYGFHRGQPSVCPRAGRAKGCPYNFAYGAGVGNFVSEPTPILSDPELDWPSGTKNGLRLGPALIPACTLQASDGSFGVIDLVGTRTCHEGQSSERGEDRAGAAGYVPQV